MLRRVPLNVSVGRLRRLAPTSREAARILRAKEGFDATVEKIDGGAGANVVLPMLSAVLRDSELVVALSPRSNARLVDLCAQSEPTSDAVLARGFIHLLNADERGAMRELGENDEAAVARMRGCVRQFLGEYRESVFDFDVALARGDNLEDRFLRAWSKFAAEALDDARADYEGFIEACAGDERKLCEAYYHLGIIEFLPEPGVFPGAGPSNDALARARDLYDRGLNAEVARCPIFADEPPSQMRRHLDDFITGAQALRTASKTASGARVVKPT